MIKLAKDIYHAMKERHAKLLEYAGRIGYNAVVAFQPENVFYLTHFWGEAVAICMDNKTKLIAPALEVDRAQQSSFKDCEIISTERGRDMICTSYLRNQWKSNMYRL